MQPFDADTGGRTVGHIQNNRAFADDRMLKLRNLVTLRQIGVEIVLSLKNAIQIDLRLEPEPRPHRLFDTVFVDNRKHPRHRSIHQCHLGVWFSPEICRRA